MRRFPCAGFHAHSMPGGVIVPSLRARSMGPPKFKPLFNMQLKKTEGTPGDLSVRSVCYPAEGDAPEGEAEAADETSMMLLGGTEGDYALANWRGAEEDEGSNKALSLLGECRTKAPLSMGKRGDNQSFGTWI